MARALPQTKTPKTVPLLFHFTKPMLGIPSPSDQHAIPQPQWLFHEAQLSKGRALSEPIAVLHCRQLSSSPSSRALATPVSQICTAPLLRRRHLQFHTAASVPVPSSFAPRPSPASLTLSPHLCRCHLHRSPSQKPCCRLCPCINSDATAVSTQAAITDDPGHPSLPPSN
jgi:hypothetical protein